MLTFLSPVELLATLFGLTCVWLTLRENIWCWPAGLVQVSLYIAVFYQARLYSEMGLHIIYVFLQIYGWYHWLHGGEDRGRLSISRLPPAVAARWAAIALASTVVLGWIMDSRTDAALPYWDAAATVLSLIAQWLMARKVLESWLIWILVDIMAVGIYLSSALYLSAGLYGVFLVLATSGFLSWKTRCQSAAPA
ncbi:MAG: nicotinamide mononucleotide transporter [Bradymonadales bacterium]|nr:nicotinamide mononucleotide transporter [Bradymonadales bacterium]